MTALTLWLAWGLMAFICGRIWGAIWDRKPDPRHHRYLNNPDRAIQRPGTQARGKYQQYHNL